MGKTFNFISGALFGAAAGAIIGVALAPRSAPRPAPWLPISQTTPGITCATPTSTVPRRPGAAVNDFGPMVDAKTDDLRAKVDLARERMDQLREQLNDAISGGNVTPAADVVVENAVEADAEAAEPSTEA